MDFFFSVCYNFIIKIQRQEKRESKAVPKGKNEAMKNKTLAELNEQYKDCPINSATYEIDGKFYTVTAHFVGKKNLDEVIYRNAFEKAFAETEKQAEKF